MAKLNIVCGNILDYLDNKDLILNSINKNMLCGSGICKFIYEKTNKEFLEEYCKKQCKDNMKVNEIIFIPGFDIGIDILHILCPNYYGYKDANVAIDDLLFSYYKIIIEAKKICIKVLLVLA